MVGEHFVPFFVFFLGVRGVNSSTPNSGGLLYLPIIRIPVIKSWDEQIPNIR